MPTNNNAIVFFISFPFLFSFFLLVCKPVYLKLPLFLPPTITKIDKDATKLLGDHRPVVHSKPSCLIVGTTKLKINFAEG